MQLPTKTILEAARKRCVPPTYVELARRLGRTPGALSQWSRVPDRLVLQIEAISGLRREQIRYDLHAPAGSPVARRKRGGP